MKNKKILLWVVTILLIFCLGFIFLQKKETAPTVKQIGLYSYSESAPDYLWDYQLTLAKNNVGTLSVDSFQTQINVFTAQKTNADGSMDVFFNGYYGDNLFHDFSQGDRLFTLEPVKNGYRIIWDKLKFRLIGDADNAVFEPMLPGGDNVMASSKQDVITVNDFKEAKMLPTATLKQSIIDGVSSLQKSNDQKINLKISAYLTEYVSRVPEDVDFETLSNDMKISTSTLSDLFENTFFSPCWGIPPGQCTE